MNETTFENARVGDRVWDMQHGDGIVERIEKDATYPLIVRHKHGLVGLEKYTLDGRYALLRGRTLFWSEIKYEVPTRPKRMVKKEIRGWVNVYSDSTERGYSIFFLSKEFADANQLPNRITCVEIVKEYEVEE